MAQIIMYPGMVNSPMTQLSAAIDAVQNTIPLVDASVLPAGPNICTIGSDETAETILYTAKSVSTLTGVTRGFQGAAKVWSSGAKVARYLTAYDTDTFKANIEDHETRMGPLASLLTAVKTSIVNAINELFNITPKKSTQDMTYYVDPAGSDTNNGLSAGAAGAFKTWAKARSMFPQVLNHNYTVNIAPGTYPETLDLVGIMGNGVIIINGSNVADNTRVFNKIQFLNIGVVVLYTGLNLITTTDHAISVFRCTDTRGSYMKIDVVSSFNGVSSQQCVGTQISNSILSNHSAGLQVANGNMLSQNNTGTGNTNGLESSAGIIFKNGTQPAGTTAELKGSGGQIF